MRSSCWGLLPEPQTEEILARHRLALERKGFGNVWGVTKGELTVRPGAHHGPDRAGPGVQRPKRIDPQHSRSTPSPAR
jgi:hypothetical protein